MSVHTSPQKDRFVHERMPPRDQWPVILPLPGIPHSGPLNCVEFLIDRHLATAVIDRPAIKSKNRVWTYADLARRVCQIAHVLAGNFHVQPGNRVLIRGANSPEAVAIWLAIQRIGAIAVTTMSLLRAAELKQILQISQPTLALCQAGLEPELAEAIVAAEMNLPLLQYDEDRGPLFAQMMNMPSHFPACPTLADDISILAFTSGTTGRPKATVHFHRDILAICETVSRHILRPSSQDIFIGTAPLAFTFGLGGLLVFPLHAGACSILHDRYSPDEFLTAIERYNATICMTVPTYYQQMLRLDDVASLKSLRLAVCSGEALPAQVRDRWLEKTGLQLTEVLGSTEMLHAFAGATGKDIRYGFIGPAIEGYEVMVMDEAGNAAAHDTIGRFAVRGPTGCRYLNDPRQTDYVQHGWNVTGDACAMSADGYVAYHTRYDDMIISSGYNISALDVENALLTHPEVAECAVLGEPDEDRGQIVVACIVRKTGASAGKELAKQLQDHVKNAIAPYKYPRRIRFMRALPRNESGKIQRFKLRDPV